MPQNNRYEQQFLDALKDIFIGAKVEGESGYINLMKIKARYFESGVFPILMKNIDAACRPFEKSFREELFDKLYDFFKRYFSESGSIYFRNTALHQNIYERIYTDDRDVILFWKTHMLYYVKTDRLFNSMDVDVDGTLFFFDVSGLEHKRANEKRELLYTFSGYKGGKVILAVDYSEKGRKTKPDDIRRALKEKGIDLDEEALERACRIFEKQSEVDYFINKNAKAFLKEQFDLWLYQYVFSGESSFTEARLKELQTIKDIAYKIIDFIAQFEDELVRVWNKPKFVLNSHYILTLDKISEASLLERIFAHPGMAAQVQEWQALGMLDGDVMLRSELGDEASLPNAPKDVMLRSVLGDEASLSNTPKDVMLRSVLGDEASLFDNLKRDSSPLPPFGGQAGAQNDGPRVDPQRLLQRILEKDLTSAPLNTAYQHLPLDTRYFPDLELDILALFDDLDAALDGWLVHSENYQALNTLLPKFRERVKCVYIDPPFNTAASEIIYKNNYKHSSWLSLIYDRLKQTNSFMAEDAILCVAIDDFELPVLNIVLSLIYRDENHLSTIAVRSNPHGRAMATGFSQNHEYALFYSKAKEAVVGRLPRDEKKQGRYPESDKEGPFTWMNFRATGANSRRVDRRKLFYPVYVSENGKIRIVDMIWSNLDQKWETQEKHKQNETVVLPIDSDKSERVWNLGWVQAQKDTESELSAKMIAGEWQIYRKYRPNPEGILPNTWWDDAKYSATESGTRIIKDLLGKRELFSYPKSIYLVEDCLRSANCSQEAITLDFFAGSGTTAHAVMNLNREDGGRRKYILVEMGEHFNTVILPRIKKVAFSDQWKEGKAVKGGRGISHFAKYYDLEQYEDTLRRAHYEDAPLLKGADAYNSYVFLRDLKMLDAITLDQEHNKVIVHPETLYPGIDLAETLSCVTGKGIRRITRETVEFQDGTTANLSDPDWALFKPLVWWS